MVTLSLYRNSSHSFAIFGNILLPKVAKNGNFIDLKSAIFGNFLKQNVAKNGKNVTQVPIEGQSNHFIANLK